MSDINRKPSESTYHNVHSHTCPNCKRGYSCNCHNNADKPSMVCIDCERGNYNPVIHGGQGTKAEA